MLALIIYVNANLTNHNYEEFVTKVTLLDNDFTFVIDALMQLIADVGQCLATVVREEGHVLLQMHPEVEVLG